MGKTTPPPASRPSWETLLAQAVSEPGILHDGYKAFWRFSVGNQHLALAECLGRRIPIGPLKTVKQWNEVERKVRSGEKAISLWMPIRVKAKEPEQAVEPGKQSGFTFYRLLPRWFTVHQTEGEPWEPPPLPDWSMAQALDTLQVEQVPFGILNGNVQGYSLVEKQQFALNPLARYPLKTTFHELAHILLQHEHTGQHNVQEVEAELTAYLLLATLAVEKPAMTSARAYAQRYGGADVLDAKVAQRVYTTASRILRAGHPAKAKATDSEEAA